TAPSPKLNVVNRYEPSVPICPVATCPASDAPPLGGKITSPAAKGFPFWVTLPLTGATFGLLASTPQPANSTERPTTPAIGNLISNPPSRSEHDPHEIWRKPEPRRRIRSSFVEPHNEPR